jgi:hypothetical protein
MHVQGFVGVIVHWTLFADKLNKLWSEKHETKTTYRQYIASPLCAVPNKILHLLTTNVGIGGEQDGEACRRGGGLMSHDGPLGQIGWNHCDASKDGDPIGM